MLVRHSKFNSVLRQHLERLRQQAKKKALFLGPKSVEMGGIEPPKRGLKRGTFKYPECL